MPDVGRKTLFRAMPPAGLRVGIFSKFHASGGSERRCIEMANALVRSGTHIAWLLCETGFSSRLTEITDSRVMIYRNWPIDLPAGAPRAEDLDCLLIVNTDSKEYCQHEFWEQRAALNQAAFDICHLRQMVFLFNFIVSPSRTLASIAERCPRVRIITANRKFYDEIDDQDRYRAIRHLPRLILESPIDPQSVSREKSASTRLRLGCHGSPSADKWNSDWPELITRVNAACGHDCVAWRFLGMPQPLAQTLLSIPNVTAHPAWSLPVGEFLKSLDICVSFPSWKREEPWSRSIAEAMMSGCPVITTPRGGNRDQVSSGVNGWLCRSLDDFVRCVAELVEIPERRHEMSRNACRLAESFQSSQVVSKFIEFIRNR